MCGNCSDVTALKPRPGQEPSPQGAQLQLQPATEPATAAMYQPRGESSVRKRSSWGFTVLIAAAVLGLTVLAFVSSYLVINFYQDGASSIDWFDGLPF